MNSLAGIAGQVWIPLAAAFVVCLLVTPIVIRIVTGRGLVADVKDDRWHTRPTALLGGIAIYLGVGAGFVVAQPSASLMWIWAGATVMFVTGLVDDRIGVAPAIKLLAQVVAAAILLLAGYRLVPSLPVWFSMPVTFLWIIGLTNGFNLLDNMDGLAAGIAAIAAASLGILLMLDGNASVAGAALAVAGASAAFLFYNFKPARIFMGDCGSLVLGYTLAALAVANPGSRVGINLAALLVVPITVMAVPIFDTTLVTVRRILVGRRVSQGGRDHSSHRLVSLGLSERRAVLTLYAVAALFGALALVFQNTNLVLFWSLVAYGVIGLTVFGVFLSETTVYEPEAEALGRRRLDGLDEQDHVLLRTMMRHKKHLVGVVVDLMLVLAALPLAYYLRFEDALIGPELDTLIMALPIVAVIKMTTFYGFGLYRGLWRYAGSEEALRVARASLIGSALSVLALLALYRFEGFSRTAFAIDWLLTTGSLVSVRVAYRALAGYFAVRRSEGRRVLIYGAGDAGSMALRELRQNKDHGIIPVGFIDDDPTKQGLVMHGIPVVGGREELSVYGRRHDVEEIIVAISRIDEAARIELYEACAAAGLSCRSLSLSFTPVRKPGEDMARPSVVA